PSTPDETVAESQNSSIPETTDIPPEALDEATPELAEAADVIPEQVAARLPDPETVAEPVLPSPRKPPPSEQTTPDPPAEEVTTEPAQLAGAGGEAGTLDDGDLGSGQNATGGGAVGARADYFAVLQAWLEQHKVYPRGALTRRLEGVVSLRFIIDREGRVLDYNIEKSSGHRLLDRAITALIERAQPLPTMPDDIKETNLTLVVPISFVLK
ncbi:MAG: energy transducer TonB, partial [Pseudomonadota bacterium]